MSEAQKPLAGLKVVELGTLIAGPFCTRIMAEFGAEVIKVGVRPMAATRCASGASCMKAHHCGGTSSRATRSR